MSELRSNEDEAKMRAVLDVQATILDGPWNQEKWHTAISDLLASAPGVLAEVTRLRTERDGYKDAAVYERDRARAAESDAAAARVELRANADYSRFEVYATELDFDLECRDCPWSNRSFPVGRAGTLKGMMDLADKHRQEVHA